MKKLLMVFLIAISVGGTTYAQSLTSFNSGDIITADAMNGNFSEIESYLFWQPLAVPNGDIYYNGGKVGIGTDSPDVLLEATSVDSVSALTNNYGEIRISDIHPQLDFIDSDGADWAIHVNSDKLNFLTEPWNVAMTLEGQRMGIGTTSPADNLHVRDTSGHAGIRVENSLGGNTNSYIDFVSGAKTWRIFNYENNHTFGIFDGSNGGGTHFRIYGETQVMALMENGGNVGIGTTSPSQELHVVGNITCTGNITESSDMRLKENISKIVKPLDILQEINGVYFNMVGSEKKEVGVLAQDVQKRLPEAVSVVDKQNGYLGVSYSDLVPVLIESVKEQQEMIDAQQEQIDELKAMVRVLTSTINGEE